MKAKLLLKLADFLDTQVPQKYFEGYSYGEGDFSKNICGTRACALGWGVVAFKKSLKPLYNYGKCVNGIWDNNAIAYMDVIYKSRKTDKEYKNIDAAAKFFDIPYNDANDLFICKVMAKENIHSPKRMAKVIRKYVKENMNKRLKYVGESD